ncbi:RING-box protein 1A [Cladophialophora carrionii]|uniref:RING-box protein 1A n=1 Tax=Cladophialophora carrionii TaxID=86049 RepID=A0A1C1CQ91_9EURO|nr:RING-box protein 1A [Cladophialophora carrionii]
MADVEMKDASLTEAKAKVPVKASKGGAAEGGDTKKRFEVKKWNAVALWAWDIVVDNCAICRNHIMDLCIECQANQGAATNEECTVAWACLPFPLHLTLAEDPTSLPTRQQRLGVPEVRKIVVLWGREQDVKYSKEHGLCMEQPPKLQVIPPTELA